MKKKTMPELGRPDINTYRDTRKLPVTVVLDNVRSEMNVGSILRTADAFLMEEVVLCGITPTPPKSEIHKTALGAEDSVRWRYEASSAGVVADLRARGYVVCAVEQVHGSIDLRQFHPEPDKRYAVVLGHEVRGVSQEVVDGSDVCLEIPQFGTKHSLNVANSAAIVFWHFLSSLVSV